MFSPAPRSSTSPLVASLTAAALAVTTGACGGGGDAGAGSGDGATAKPAALDVEATDFAFAPATLSAPAGSAVKLTLRNSGDAPHTFTSDVLDVDEQAEAGKSVEVSFTMPDSGSVEFVCTLHEAQGMKGAIQVA